MKNKGHEVTKILPGGIAEEIGIRPGMRLLEINGRPVADVFDYRFFMDSEYVEMLFAGEDGEEVLYEIEKDRDEDFGAEYGSSLMDKYRGCSNRCIFCFIDQLPKGMRRTLYFKDDDARLSFLQGNYITMTNMSDFDLQRVIDYRMQPVNISVHATDPELRCRMLGNPKAGDILERMKRLADAGISMNAQIVLCPGWNDGEQLDRTIGDLAKLRPALRSVSAVPVGLTRFREHLTPLTPFGREGAAGVIRQIREWQEKLSRDGLGDPQYSHFIHASDEFYLTAGVELPGTELYDGYPQIENGVGMVRSLIDEVDALLAETDAGDVDDRRVIMACGTLVAPVIRELSQKVCEKYRGICADVLPVENDFFGRTVTVSGLVTGRDLIRSVKENARGGDYDELILPVNMLRSGTTVFLDDVTIEDVETETGLPVRAADTNGEDFVRSIRGLERMRSLTRQVYEPDAAGWEEQGPQDGENKESI